MTGLFRSVLQVFFHHLLVVSVNLSQGIALFSNRKADHLERRGGKGPQQPGIIRLFPGLRNHRFRNGCHDFLVDGRVRVQGHAQRQVVISAVDHPDIIHIKGICGDNAPV